MAKLDQVLDYLEPQEREKVRRAVDAHDALVSALREAREWADQTLTSGTRLEVLARYDATLRLAEGK